MQLSDGADANPQAAIGQLVSYSQTLVSSFGSLL
jgi:hypothetical protein